MTEVDNFIYDLMHNYNSVNTVEADAIINNATDFMYGNPDKEEVKKVASALVHHFIAGYNDYVNISEFLDNSKALKKDWERARQAVFAGNNSGWSMCVKQLFGDLAKE